MKKTLLILVLMIASNWSVAQEFEKDRNYVQVGYGLGLGYGRLLSTYSTYSNYRYGGFGPVALSYERGITDNIGIGIQFGFSSYGATWNDNFGVGADYKYRWTNLTLMARGAYHFDVRNRKLDRYAGVGIGFAKYSYKYTSTDPTFTGSNVSFGSPLAYQIFGGLRYMFKDNFGVYAEAGYGYSVFNGGLTLSLIHI
jgi:hypothetical protein